MDRALAKLRSPWGALSRHTIRSAVSIRGVGIHSGLATRVTLKPSATPQGVLLNGAPLSDWRLASSRWATRITLDATSPEQRRLPTTISTPEHLFAALYGAGVDDVEVEVEPDLPRHMHAQRDEVEVPILDGSAARYLELIEAVPTGDGSHQRTFTQLPQLYLRGEGGSIQSRPEPLKGAEGQMTFRLTTTLVELYPELSSRASIDAPIAARLRASQVARLNTFQDFVNHIAPARTFGLRAHEDFLRAQGLIQGVSLENTIALDERGVPSVGLRHPHELAAHKLLDVIGDFALSGIRWRGHLEVHRGSHALNHALLRHLERAR